MGSDEKVPSTRAIRPGQVWCRCADPTHPHHQRRDCGNDVFKDGYCRDCYELLFGSTGGGPFAE